MRAREFIKEDEQPTGEYRLIRVVPSVDNIVREPDGTLSIRQQQGSTRGTVHWTVNSTVGSHTLGNWDKSGFVIIADPKEIKAPLLGARPDDTWYALDKNSKLNIGKATILAPQGADVPKGLPVEYYSSDRNQAVKQELTKQGVRYMGTTGATGVGGLDINQFGKMGKDFAARYGNQGPATLDSHMNTLHSRAEGKLAGINYAIDKMKSGQELIKLSSQADVPYTTHTQQEIRDFKQSIADYQKQNPKAAAYEANYWTKINQQLDQASKQIDVLDAKFQVDKAARIAARKKASVPPPPPPPTAPKPPLSTKSLNMRGPGGLTGDSDALLSPDYSMGLDPSYELTRRKFTRGSR
jgi:hypothetical protein